MILSGSRHPVTLGIDMLWRKVIGGGLLVVGSAGALVAQAPAPKPTLYVVGYSHLDTEWLWEYPHSIDEFLPATMRDNFALLDKYPAYVFNFSGANRYRMMKEYYPVDYARIRRYTASGRWIPAGSSMEEGDVNAPSPEAILRQILYGNQYFRREFGRATTDFLLPDCFGFPWSLPTVLSHAGLQGFSTGKLIWGSSVPDQPTTPYGMEGKGIPFNFGVWTGPDGKGVVAALNPGEYIRHVNTDLSRAETQDSSTAPNPPETWLERLRRNQRMLGVPFDYLYYGTGDIGGAPNEGTVWWIQKAVRNTTGPIRVVSASSDRFFRDLTAAQVARLPTYAGEMELTNHSAGSLTSQAYHKRWMRRNEILADAAEKASVAAEWLGARAYPRERLNDAWTLMLAGHFHDIAAGTATPKAYQYAWNDAIVAMNQLVGVVTDASEALAASLDTRAEGVAVVVYNPLDGDREDVVETELRFPNGQPVGVKVVGPDGVDVPAQVAPGSNGSSKVLFLAKVPSVGYAVYDVRPAPTPAASELVVTERTLENGRYRVTVDDRGDVASVFDKRLRRELLASPMRLAIKDDTPNEWPAWNMDWTDQIKTPRAYVGGTPKISIDERGPARVALRVERWFDSSRFVQTIRLAAGDAGNRVEIHSAIDWKEPNAALKAVVPFTAWNDSATYNLGVGTIRRGTASERKFEVLAHQWIDLTDASGSHGVTLLTGDKLGSDKTDANTIGLTLLRTPGISESGRFYGHQATQDWGHHEIEYGIAGHAGDWRAAQTDRQALRMDVPLLAFETSPHNGPLGRRFSLLTVSSPRVRVMALKKAEQGAEYVVRLVEAGGQSQRGVRISFPRAVVSVRELNGQEQPMAGAPPVVSGSVVASFTPNQIRTFAVKLAPAPVRRGPLRWQAVPLAYDRAVASNDGTASREGFDDSAQALPAEMLPSRLWYGGVRFDLGVAGTGKKNAIAAHGQSLRLPSGRFNRVYLLAAADGDQSGTFQVGDRKVDLTIQDWGGFVGQWDTRKWKTVEPTPEEAAFRTMVSAQADSQFRAEVDEARAVGGDTVMALAGHDRAMRLLARHVAQLDRLYDGITPGFIKRAPIAWYASHHHTAEGRNVSYAYSYLFAYTLDLPAGATTLTLPDNPKIKILAVTVAEAESDLTPAYPLYDTLGGEER
jgi:alpha-mannosidase